MPARWLFCLISGCFKAPLHPLTLARGVRCAAPLFTTRSDILGVLPWFASLPSLARRIRSEREWNSCASHHPPRTLMLYRHTKLLVFETVCARDFRPRISTLELVTMSALVETYPVIAALLVAVLSWLAIASELIFFKQKVLAVCTSIMGALGIFACFGVAQKSGSLSTAGVAITFAAFLAVSAWLWAEWSSTQKKRP
jgi:hypothetical protein